MSSYLENTAVRFDGTIMTKSKCCRKVKWYRKSVGSCSTGCVSRIVFLKLSFGGIPVNLKDRQLESSVLRSNAYFVENAFGDEVSFGESCPVIPSGFAIIII